MKFGSFLFILFLVACQPKEEGNAVSITCTFGPTERVYVRSNDMYGTIEAYVDDKCSEWLVKTGIDVYEIFPESDLVAADEGRSIVPFTIIHTFGENDEKEAKFSF